MWSFLIFYFLLTVDAKIISKNWTVSQGIRAPDGVTKLVYLINNKFLEESIVADYGDTIDLTVTNNLYMETLSIHFHGIDQKSTPYADGVSYVTQYPIIPGQSYRYYFPLLQSGTYWCHSHMSSQYSDGLYAPLIIHDPNDTYDITNTAPMIQAESVIFIADWYHQSSNWQLGTLTKKIYPWYFPPYTNVLWNGKGFFNCSQYGNQNLEFAIRSNLYNCQTQDYPRYNITSNNLPLRLRIINGGSGLTLIFSIDAHSLIVIAVDGVPVQHFSVKRILIYVGQRYDVLVYPLRSNIKTFWMRTNTLDYPIGETEQSLAILSYDSSLELPNTIAWNLKSKNLSNLETQLIPTTAVPTITNLKDIYDVVLNLTCSYTEYLCAINGVNFKPDFEPVILQQYYKREILNPGIIKIPVNRYIRLIINNPLGKSHPLHKHMRDFWILGVGAENDGYYNGQLLNYNNPIYRDTIQINPHSWMVLLFYNDDTGPITFHCHINIHSEAGMFLVFINDIDMLTPPSDYPIITNINQISKSHSFLDLDKTSVILLILIFIMVIGIIIYLILKKKKKKSYGRL